MVVLGFITLITLLSNPLSFYPYPLFVAKTHHNADVNKLARKVATDLKGGKELAKNKVTSL